MTRRAGRHLAVGALGLAVLPTVVGVALIRPAVAAAPAGQVTAAPAGQVTAAPAGQVAAGAPLGRFGLTTDAAALTSAGTVAAGGGLILTDQGAATVTGRLDNSPSSRAMAVAAEPGETYRTLSTQVSGSPAVPGSAAQFPGGPATSSDATVGATAADADQTAVDASATATPSGFSGTGAGAASASEQLTSDIAGDLLSATSTSNSGSITVGPLSIAGVVGTASVGYDATGHHADAGVVVTSASVSGTPVTIDAGGVHAAGVSPLPSGILPTAPPEPVADVLTAAGITVSFLDPVHTTTATGALADSGALVVHETTPDLTSGTTTVSSATDVTLYLGRAEATLSDAAAFPVDNLPVTTPTVATSSPTTRPSASSSPVPVPSAVAASPGHTVTTVIPGMPGVPAGPPAVAAGTPAVAGGSEAPSAAPPPPPPLATAEQPQSLQLLGARIPDTAAVAGFGVWEMLTLGIATTAALAARRRGEPEEEHLCPCP